MKSILVVLLAALCAPAIGALGNPVPVTLELREDHLLLPVTTRCTVLVPEESDAGAVLDAAVRGGCISGWSHAVDDEFGRLVTGINGKSESLGFYWAYFENGLSASHGIDRAEARAGDVFGFAFADYTTGMAVGILQSQFPVTLP